MIRFGSREWAYACMGIRLISREEMPPGLSGASPDFIIMDDLDLYTRGYSKPSFQQEYLEFLCKRLNTECTQSSMKTAPFITGHVNTAEHLLGSLRKRSALKHTAATKALLINKSTV